MNEKNDGSTLVALGIISVAVLLASLLFYIFGLNHVSVNEIGVAYNSANGELKVQPHPGWYVTSPLVKVVRLSTLPIIVHVPSAAKVINTKIVKLRSEAVLDYIKIQGFDYQLGQNQENILMGYAFSGQTFSFLEIVQQGGLESPVK